MSDTDLDRIREAALAVQRGEFSADLPSGDDQQVASLGKVLRATATDLDQRFRQHRGSAVAQHSGDEPESLLDMAMNRIWENFGEAIPFRHLSIHGLEEEESLLRTLWARSASEKQVLLPGYVAAVTDDLRETLEEAVPRSVDSIEEHLEERPDAPVVRLMQREGMQSSLTCPLTAVAEPVGFLIFGHADAGCYGDGHRATLLRLSWQLSMVLEKARLYDRLLDLTWHLGIARDAMQYQSSHDSLTGLWNRPAILDIAQREMDRAHRAQVPITLLVVDVDGLKKINETHGYETADGFLEALSRRLSDCLRSYETLGRSGGGEFLVALYDCDADGAEIAAARLQDRVAAEPFEIDDEVVDATVGIGGVSCAALEDGDAEELLKTAVETLREAKKEGPARIQVEELS